MKIETLQDRIVKAEERITKKRGTIEKKKNLIEKKRNSILTGKVTGSDASWMESEIKWLLDDINRPEREIPEIEKMIEKYRGQIDGTVERERIFLTEVPDDFKKIQEELIVRWDEYDIRHRDLMKQKAEEMGYKAFIREYSHAAYDFRLKTDEEIHEDNVKESKGYVIGLYFRIKDITGKIIDWNGIYSAGVALNGIVIGEAGKAKVETIQAGGYNIQRLHVRTLVHSI